MDIHKLSNKLKYSDFFYTKEYLESLDPSFFCYVMLISKKKVSYLIYHKGTFKDPNTQHQVSIDFDFCLSWSKFKILIQEFEKEVKYNHYPKHYYTHNLNSYLIKYFTPNKNDWFVTSGQFSLSNKNKVIFKPYEDYIPKDCDITFDIIFDIIEYNKFYNWMIENFK